MHHTSPPAGWPRLSQSLHYLDPLAAIDWLVHAFGFAVRLKVCDDTGQLVHSELTFGEGLLMVGGTGAAGHPEQAWRHIIKSPRELGGAISQAVCLFVDDVDAHCAQAQAHGATIVRPPVTNDYGEGYWVDRSYGALDCEGHLWWFMQRLRTYPTTAPSTT